MSGKQAVYSYPAMSGVMEGTMSFSGVYQRAARAMIRVMLAALGIAFFASTAHAQSSTGQANANIRSQIALVEPLTILKTRDMDFGDIVGVAAGTVVMTATANTTCTASAGIVHVGVCQPATFAGSGTSGRVIRIRKPAGNSITLTGPGQDMTVTDFQIDGDPELFQLNNSNGFSRYRIDSANGGFNFRVGGTLNVNANQAAGEYTGTFLIEVVYG